MLQLQLPELVIPLSVQFFPSHKLQFGQFGYLIYCYKQQPITHIQLVVTVPILMYTVVLFFS